MEQEDKVIAVKKMQDYITDNLENNITLKGLSREAGYSLWHCSRIFKELIGISPFDYIRDLRLTQAAKSLRDCGGKIIDTAFDFLFDSHEGFTRAFTKKFGLSPIKYRNNPIPVQYFIPYDVLSSNFYFKKEGEKMDTKKNSIVFVQVVERPLRKAIIKRAYKAKHYFEYCEEVGCDIWGMLVSIKDAMFEPVGLWLPKKLILPDTSEYVQGVEVAHNYNGIIPEGFEIIELEPVKMMIFQGEPFENIDFEKAIIEVQQSIEKFNPNTYGYNWADDDAPWFQLAPEGSRGYIEARPVKEIK